MGKLGENKMHGKRVAYGRGEEKRRGIQGLRRGEETASLGKHETGSRSDPEKLGRGILVGRGWPRGGAASEDARQDAGLAPTIEGAKMKKKKTIVTLYQRKRELRDKGRLKETKQIKQKQAERKWMLQVRLGWTWVAKADGWNKLR